MEDKVESRNSHDLPLQCVDLTPLSTTLRGLSLQPDPTDDLCEVCCKVDFGLLRNWLHLCETEHGDRCSQSSLVSETGRKIRLIDVLNRQLVDSTTNERYLTLSYVWGSWEQFTLTSRNIGDLRASHSLKGEDMIRTIQDAFDAVARMGERYLWVDRLCILMDDEQDKLEQMSNMDQIYNAAVLTIVTSSACCQCGSNACIPGVQPDTRQLLQHSEVIRGKRFVTTQSDLVSAIRMLNWSSRGWTFQEGFLSSRCLVFTPYQTYFQCKSEEWCEDSCWVGAKPLEPKAPVGNALCHIRDYPDTFIRCDFNQYVDAVEAYSTRNLTLETDALWAFTGITKAFQLQFQNGFAWGLPIENLDAALLWCPLKLQQGSRKGLHAAILDHHTVRLPFPTWAWVSWRGGVVYGAKCEKEVTGLVEWHPPAHYSVNPKNPLSDQVDKHSPTSIHSSESTQSEDVIMDERALGLLRFTAATAYFDLKAQGAYAHEDHTKDCAFCKQWSLCHIRARSGKNVGGIWVPKPWFEARSASQAEFILLSKHIQNAEDETCQQVWTPGTDPRYPNKRIGKGIKHVDGCEHQSGYNIMLVDWKEGPHCRVAVRMGIAIIHRNDWQEAETSSKLVVLS
ncbi:HET-domain-containing protein [Mollisia scopiformis]|uniref:HET-domain-containing protein n=1 Tax=Mollisia scopiformis TaxID=149040 RepID=A0A132B3M2_MOLSC|nr:HET-domain-containing protein [Mollisia scopiformis]KUJ06982.1 HET-domain-containing protein [Mollisia scopiformis]